jgi:hypothetical protein
MLFITPVDGFIDSLSGPVNQLTTESTNPHDRILRVLDQADRLRMPRPTPHAPLTKLIGSTCPDQPRARPRPIRSAPHAQTDLTRASIPCDSTIFCFRSVILLYRHPFCYNELNHFIRYFWYFCSKSFFYSKLNHFYYSAESSFDWYNAQPFLFDTMVKHSLLI